MTDLALFDLAALAADAEPDAIAPAGVPERFTLAGHHPDDFDEAHEAVSQRQRRHYDDDLATRYSGMWRRDAVTTRLFVNLARAPANSASPVDLGLGDCVFRCANGYNNVVFSMFSSSLRGSWDRARCRCRQSPCPPVRLRASMTAIESLGRGGAVLKGLLPVV